MEHGDHIKIIGRDGVYVIPERSLRNGNRSTRSNKSR
jgi:hypothetical protein